MTNFAVTTTVIEDIAHIQVDLGIVDDFLSVKKVVKLYKSHIFRDIL